MQILEHEPLSKHTYYRIGGPAQYLAFPKNLDDLRTLSREILRSGLPWFVLGAGTNVLASDQGFSGYVIKTAQLCLETSLMPNQILRTGCGVAVSSLMRRCGEEGWGGLEFLTGIPGQVGGVIAMNAGTHLGETKDRIKRVDVFSFERPEELICFSGDELKMEYRKNLFLPQGAIVYSVDWLITPRRPSEVKELVSATLARRKATQPLESPSCGSVFKNPRDGGLQAWQVIDKLGLRGHRIGGAQISEKHSNWILNLGGAMASDVQALIQLVRTRAKKELRIEMQPEVVMLG